MTTQGRVEFFYQHAGYSYGHGETPEEGRLRCARRLAEAEEWAYGFIDINLWVHTWWSEDTDADRSWLNEIDDRPLWGCIVSLRTSEDDRVDSESLWSIDLGPNGDDKDYKRVVEAELIADLYHRWQCRQVGLREDTPGWMVRDKMMEDGLVEG